MRGARRRDVAALDLAEHGFHVGDMRFSTVKSPACAAPEKAKPAATAQGPGQEGRQQGRKARLRMTRLVVTVVPVESAQTGAQMEIYIYSNICK